MLRSRKVMVGKCYINNGRKIAREVLSICDNTILFINHHLDTGNSCGQVSMCLKADFVHWADREATPAEMANLQYRKGEAQLEISPLPILEGFNHAPSESKPRSFARL